MENVIGPFFLRVWCNSGETFWSSIRFFSWKVMQFNMLPDMGFLLLYREFLHFSFGETSHGVNLILLCSHVLIFAIQVGYMWVHSSHGLPNHMGMYPYMFFSLRLLLQRFFLKPRHKRHRRRHQTDIEGVYISTTFSEEEEEGQGSLYHRASSKIEGRRSVRDQRKEHFRKSLRPNKNNKMHRRRRR